MTRDFTCHTLTESFISDRPQAKVLVSWEQEGSNTFILCFYATHTLQSRAIPKVNKGEKAYNIHGRSDAHCKKSSSQPCYKVSDHVVAKARHRQESLQGDPHMKQLRIEGLP